MKLQKVAGATSEIWQIFIRDSSSTTGGGLTGLTNASAGLTAYYHRDTDTTATAISLVSMTVGTFTSSGFKEIDATNMPGWYQFCPPNAAIAAGAKSCAFHLKGATNMAPLPIEVQLTAVNFDSASAFMTGVNSLAPPTNWNLDSIDGSGRRDISKIAGQTLTASGGITFPAATLASTTNITAATGVVLSGVTHTGAVIPTVSAVTGLTASNLDTTVSSRATPAQILTTQLTESYNADGSAPTLTQALMLIMQILSESSVSSTTMTVKKLDGTTTAATFTLNSATTPTSVTRAT